MSVDFYRLPRAVQERFLDCSRGRFEPTPWLLEPHRRRTHLMWAAVGIVLAVVGFASALLGFGKLDSSLAIEPPLAIGAYAGAFVLSGVCLIRAQRLRRAGGQSPFVLGTYVFPIGVVDAPSRKLSTFPWTELASVAVEGQCVKLSFGAGASFSFVADSAERAQQIEREIPESRAKLEEARARNDTTKLAQLDPLLDTGLVSPLGPSQTIPPPAAPSRVTTALALVVVGGALGAGVWWGRNTMSEEKIFSETVARDEPAAYEAYLERGGNRPEVRDTLLPRALLRVEQAKGTVEAIEGFRERFPSTKIKPEVDAALRAALLDELKKAKAEGTLDALERFSERRARYETFLPELGEARRQLFAAALEKFRSGPPKKEPALVDLVGRLVRRAEKHGPTVAVRFVHRDDASHELADSRVRRSPYYMGKVSLPSQFFTVRSLTPIARSSGDRLVKGLQTVFARGLLAFDLADEIETSEVDTSALEVPTVLVAYRVRFSGSFVSMKPRAAFVGAGIVFESTLVVPGETETFEHAKKFWKVPPLSMLGEGGAEPGAVYEKMASEAFSAFADEYVAMFGGR